MKYFYFGVFFLFFSNTFAQKVQVKKADKQYEKFAYVDAIVTYEKVMKKGYKTPEMLQKVGDAYYFNSQFLDAGMWYAELFKLQPEATNPEYYYRYAQCLRSLEDYKQADVYLEKFYQAKGDDFRAELYKSSENYLEIINKNSGRFAIQPAMALNSEYSDYGTTLYDGKIIFASTRKNSVLT